MRRAILLLAAIGLSLVGSLHAATTAPSVPGGFVNSELPWHDAVLDSDGKLLAWYHPEKNLGYDHVLHLAWDFIEHKVPNDPKSGLKAYLVNAVFDGKTLQGTNWQGNPASMFAQFVDSVVAWYPYSGDEEAIAVVRSMLDHMLAHGTTPADWNWRRVPFATSKKNDPEYGRALRGMPYDFFGGIETDKVGELGTGYVLFYELTGEKRYLDAAIACADALASHIRPGDETHTPWPFRVDAKSGDVLNAEEYGGMVVAPVRLFAELIRIKQGDVQKYAQAQKTAWDWILQHPMRNNGWSGYYEDVLKNPQNVNQISPTMTAYYLLSAADPQKIDGHWKGHAGHLIDWVRQKFGRGPYLGAWAIDEQGPPPDYCGCCSRAGLGSDTSRWAAINAMYYEKTGDLQAREDAFRSLNYATYFCGDDGKIACCGLDYSDTYWFSDGYSDHLRHYLWAMGGIPQFAPVGENHLLRSSSVVTKVTYSDGAILYKTFDEEGREVLRVKSRPARVTCGQKALDEVRDADAEGFTLKPLDGGDFVVRVHHRSRDVELKF